MNFTMRFDTSVLRDETKRIHIAYVAAWATILAVLIVMAGVSFMSPGWDESVFAYVGRGILEGEVPYVDRWDHKGPVTYIIYALGSILEERWGIWLINVSFMLVSAFLSYRIAQREFGSTAGLFSAATLLIYVTKLGGGGGLTESYALLFQLLALYLFLSAVREGGPGPRRCVALGMLGALSFLLRANLIGVWVTIGIYWLSRWRQSGTSVLWATVGGLSVLAATFFALVYLRAWDEFWSATVLYNYAHSDASLGERVRAVMLLVWYLSPVVPLFGIGWCVGAWYQFTGRTKGEPFEPAFKFLLILGPVEVALSLVSGNAWSHYYMPIVPAGTMYVGFLIWLVSKRRLAAPAFLALLVLFATANYHMNIYDKAFDFVSMLKSNGNDSEISSIDRDRRVSEIVESYSGDEDTILVWGTYPQIYLMTERDAPTRFFYQYPLLKKGYWRESDHAEFFSDVVSNPPTVIVDARHPSLPPLDAASRNDWSPSKRQYVHDPASLQMFFDYVDNEYELKEIVGEHWVYIAQK